MKDSNEFTRQFEVLADMEHVVVSLMERHLHKRGDIWFSSDFLPASSGDRNEDAVRVLRERARRLPDAVLVSLALNLFTEEGLPHYHRIIAMTAGYDSAIRRWNNLWTAEEDRHGGVIRDYSRDSRVFRFREIEVHQFDFINVGFNPRWVGGPPYPLYAYTTIQERATQYSHERTGSAAGEYEPLLREILHRVAGDEARHYAFYLDLMKEIVSRDPNGALPAIQDIMSHFDMPGTDMPQFREYADVVSRLGIYTLRHYAEILRQVTAHWRVEALTGLSAEAAVAQEAILGAPGRFQTIAERLERGTKQKSFSFDFLGGRTFTLGG